MALRTAHLPKPVGRQLAAFYRVKRLYAMLRVLIVTMVAYVLLALVAMHVDRFGSLTVDARWTMMLSVHAAAGLVLLLGLAWYAWRRDSAQRIAYELEQRLGGEANEQYVTLNDVLHSGGAEAGTVRADLIGYLQTATLDTASGVKAGRLVRDRLLARLLVLGVVVLMLLGGLALWSNYELPLMTQRFFFPHRNLPKASLIKIDVTLTPDRPMMGEGDDIVIHAHLDDRAPAALRWVQSWFVDTSQQAVLTIDGPGEQPLAELAGAQVRMTRVRQDAFVFSRSDVRDSFRFMVHCGNAQTAERVMEVVPRPVVVDMQLRVTPPAYTGLEPTVITDVHQPLFFLKESRVEFTFRTTQAVPTRELRVEEVDRTFEPEWDEATRTGRYDFVLRDQATVTLRVVNERGFANADRAGFAVGMRPDREPTVTVDAPEGELTLSVTDVFPLRIEAEDDLGVNELKLRYLVNPGWDVGAMDGAVEVPIERRGEARVTAQTQFDLAVTSAQPGDLVQVQATARDTADGLGTSRPILIRIAPSTRGENERLRITALSLINSAVEQLLYSSAPDDQPPGSAAGIATGTWESIRELAAEQNIPLADEPSMQSLLQLIELEHHFTDSPTDKRDLRQLYGVLHAASMPLDAAGWSSPYDAAVETYAIISTETVPSLLRYRRLRNAVVRLFAMQQEAQRLADAFAALGDEQSAPEHVMRTLDRRAALSAALLTQEIGSTLRDRALGLPADLRSAVVALMAELDTSAKAMQEGGAAARSEAGAQVAAHVGQLLEQLQPALPDALVRAQAAREQLDTFYRRPLVQVAEGPVGVDDAAAWYRRAQTWLAADARLLGREPHASLWARAVRWGMEHGIAQVAEASAAAAPEATPAEDADKGADEAAEPAPSPEAARREQAAALLNPDETLAAAAEDDRVARLVLHAMWRQQDVLDDEKRLPGERQLLAALAQLELAYAIGKAPDAAAQQVLAIDLEETVTDEPAVAWPAELADPRSVRQALGEAAALLHWPEPGVMVEAVRERFEQTGKLIQESGRHQQRSEYEQFAAKRAEAGERLERDRAALTRAIDAVALRLTLLYALDEAAPPDELMLVRLRDLHALPSVATGTRITGGDIAGEVRVTPQDLLAADADFRSLTGYHNALLGRLRQALDDYAAGVAPGEEHRREFAPLAGYRSTRRYTQAALTHREHPAETAQQFLDAFEQARLSYMAGHLHHIDTAQAAAAAARAALEQDEPDVTAFNAQLAQLRENIDAFQQVVQRSGNDALVQTLRETVGEMQRRVHDLAPLSAGAEPAVISRSVYALVGLDPQLARVRGNLGATLRTEHDPGAPFLGSPAEAWDEAHWFARRHSRSRVLSQFTTAYQSLTLRLLEPLDTEATPTADAEREAMAQALFLHDLLRSELAAGRPPLREKSGQVKFSRKQYLLEELARAMKNKDMTLYVEPTMSYLVFMRDYLR